MNRDQAKNEIVISDYYKIAVLDLNEIQPIRYEYTDRYYVFFDPEARKKDKDGKPTGKTAREILNDYESGHDGLRDFTAAINRIKNRIYEAERSAKMSSPRPRGGLY